MPTFTTMASDQIMKPRSRDVAGDAKLLPGSSVKSSKSTLPYLRISPALYTTPASTSLPDPLSPSSFSPSSLYVINHKRRGPRLLKTLSQGNVGDGRKQPPSGERIDAVANTTNRNVEKENSCLQPRPESEQGGALGRSSNNPKANGFHEKMLEAGQRTGIDVVFGKDKLDDTDLRNEMVDDKELSPRKVTEQCKLDANLSNEIVETKDLSPRNGADKKPGGINTFLDMQESLSVASSTDGNELETPVKASSIFGEFYDAYEEISNDGGSQSYRNVEAQLREMRSSLILETERRKQIEESLEQMRSQWKRMSSHLSLLGFKLPSVLCSAEETNTLNVDPIEDLFQQIAVSNFVSYAVARGSVRAEVDSEMEPLIAAKKFEITRLNDRIKYYEITNREMSRRNQEAIELARQQRHRRKRRQKWFWGSIGLAITIGVTAIASWSFLPSSPKPSTSEKKAIAQ